MLRSFSLALLALALLAETAVAQTTPTTRTTTRKATTTKTRSTAPRPGNPSTHDPGDDGYAAPGEPITPPSANGKNTASYDGKPAKPAKSNTTLATPK